MLIPKDYQLALISWTDAETYGDSSWLDIDEAVDQSRTPPPVMKSVGWVLFKNDTYVAITSDMGPEECGQVTKIPLTMIEKMEWLD